MIVDRKLAEALEENARVRAALEAWKRGCDCDCRACGDLALATDLAEIAPPRTVVADEGFAAVEVQRRETEDGGEGILWPPTHDRSLCRWREGLRCECPCAVCRRNRS